MTAVEEEWPDVPELGTVPAAEIASRRDADRELMYARDLDDEIRKQRIRIEARKIVDAEQVSSVERVDAERLIDGGTFVFDAPQTVPAIWGHDGGEVIWAPGESLTIAGPNGVGKTTLTGQIVRGLLGLQDEILGYPIKAATGKVLYLAMDRPQQIARSLRRHFRGSDREVLAERLVVWKGPPPADLASNPTLLAKMAADAGASHVIIDSLKDAALGLSNDEVGAGYNRARQLALAEGVEVLELHHTVKRGQNGSRPNTLEDLYGSRWITAGCGSVILLWGTAGDPIVELSHLKTPAAPVGPFRIIHDHDAGTSSIWHASDPLSVLRAAGRGGLTAGALAVSIFETDQPDRNQVEKARRRLDGFVTNGLAEKTDGAPDPRGGPARPIYRALTEALTDPSRESALTLASSTHASSIIAGQPLTEALTALTDTTTHVSPPSFREGVTGDDPCEHCGNPLDEPGLTARCRPHHRTPEARS